MSNLRQSNLISNFDEVNTPDEDEDQSSVHSNDSF